MTGVQTCALPISTNDELRTQFQTQTFDDLSKLLASFRPLHNRTDIDNTERLYRALEIEYYYQKHPELQEIAVPIPSIIFGLHGDRDLIKKKITLRLKERLENGMIEEIENLIENGVNPDRLIFYGLEYKFVTQYLQGDLNYDTMFEKLNIAIHQFSKRQMTWFRKMEREGFIIHWIDISLSDSEKMDAIQHLLLIKKV